MSECKISSWEMRHPWVNITVSSPSPGGSVATASISLVMSAPSALPFIFSSLSPSLFHLLPRCQQVWSGWHGKTAVWLLLLSSLTDPLRRLPFFLLPSHLWFQHAWSANPPPLSTPTPTPAPLKTSWGVEEGSGMSLRWHDLHSHLAQRHNFETFTGEYIVCVSKNALLRF